MKLLLTSSGLDNEKLRKEFLKLVGKPAENIKILFIPTAANPKKDKTYLERNTKDIFLSGVKKENLIVYDLDKKNKETNFDNIDVIFTAGGNTFYLLKKVKETGFDKKIIELIKKDKIYIGISAGSIIAGPSINTATPYDNNDVGLKNLTGLNLIKELIAPHFQDKEELTIKKIEQESKREIIRLNDGQALLIINNKQEII